MHFWLEEANIKEMDDAYFQSGYTSKITHDRAVYPIFGLAGP
jgi:hypothetical protein